MLDQARLATLGLIHYAAGVPVTGASRSINQEEGDRMPKTDLGWSDDANRPLFTEGEYDDEDKSRFATEARNCFLDAVEIVAPEILTNLCEELGSLFKSAFGSDQGALSVLNEVDLESDVSIEGVELHEFQKGLLKWSKRNGLDAAWVRQSALDTLRYWASINPPKLQWRPVVRMYETFTLPSDLKFQFEFEIDSPTYKTIRKAEEELRLAFEAKLREFITNLRQRAVQARQVKSRKMPLDSHFQWLASYQCKQQSMGKIGKAKGRRSQEEAVRSAIHKVAELIDLPLRQASKGGRPKKTS